MDNLISFLVSYKDSTSPEEQLLYLRSKNKKEAREEARMTLLSSFGKIEIVSVKEEEPPSGLFFSPNR